MPLTPAQLQTLKTHILSLSGAGGEFENVPNNDDGHFAIAAALSQTAVPDFIVWKTSVATSECKDAVNWTEFINRSAGERGAFEFMLSNGVINPSRPNVRQGINDVFSGAQGATSRAALTALGKRQAKRAEKLFATGTGSDASPATMTFEGNLSFGDVAAARNLP